MLVHMQQPPPLPLPRRHLYVCNATTVPSISTCPLCHLQVYLLLSCCPCEGRISGIVDVPNACATLAIPLAIFDQDVRPKRDGGPPPQGVSVKRGPLPPKSEYTGSLPLTLNGCLCHAATGQ
jgi:Acetamidase/Formamidase family